MKENINISSQIKEILNKIIELKIEKSASPKDFYNDEISPNIST
jgi:hypothetical protein